MKISKNVWSALALSTMMGAGTASVHAFPSTDAPKGDNPPNTVRPPRDKGKPGQGKKGDWRGGKDRPDPLMRVDAEELQKLLGENLTDAQKAQLAGAAEERDQAMKAAADRFKAQVLQATGLSEQDLGKKLREQMKKMREERGDRPQGDRPNRPDRKPLPPQPAPPQPAPPQPATAPAPPPPADAQPGDDD